MAASPVKSLLGKTISCAVSVVEAGHVQDRAATSCVQREISVFMAFCRIISLPFCLSVSFEEIILPHLKSSILVVFCMSIAAGIYFKESFVFLVSIIFWIQTRYVRKYPIFF